jgi:NTP pyrophosphatase (non-canonical NTP hydrolase)
MSLTNYQEFTRSTAIYKKEDALNYLCLGLASEAGEVAGKRKKQLRDGGVDVISLVDELGDCMWYIARLADELNFSLEEVLQRNWVKLKDRQERNVLRGSGDAR